MMSEPEVGGMRQEDYSKDWVIACEESKVLCCLRTVIGGISNFDLKFLDVIKRILWFIHSLFQYFVDSWHHIAT